MLATPFGFIKMYLDGQPVQFDHIAIAPQGPFSNTDGCFLMHFRYESDGRIHTLECVIDGVFKEAFPESGERQECMSFYTESGKLSLWCEASFYDYKDYGYDFDGDYQSDGISITIFPKTQSQIFYFATSWLLSCDEKNDHQTWYGADAWCLKQIAKQ